MPTRRVAWDDVIVLKGLEETAAVVLASEEDGPAAAEEPSAPP